MDEALRLANIALSDNAELSIWLRSRRLVPQDLISQILH